MPYKQRVTGSSPVGPIYSYADVAQLAEQLICNQQVVGSIPIASSNEKPPGNFVSGLFYFSA